MPCVLLLFDVVRDISVTNQSKIIPYADKFMEETWGKLATPKLRVKEGNVCYYFEIGHCEAEQGAWGFKIQYYDIESPFFASSLDSDGEQ